MKLLLDTQAFLWFVTDDKRLSSAARELIENKENQNFLSMASVWEMAIKHSIGKLSLTRPFEQFVRHHLTKNNIELLAISLEHVLAVVALPMHHKDPFDRLLIAQTMADKFTLVSSDAVLDKYGATKIW